MQRHTVCSVVVRIAVIVLLIGWALFSSRVVAQSMVTGGSPTLQRISEQGTIRVGVHPLFKPFSFFYEIQLRDSYISGIDTLDEAIRIATEVIEENRLFIDQQAL